VGGFGVGGLENGMVGCGFVRGGDAESRAGFWAFGDHGDGEALEMRYAWNFSREFGDWHHMLLSYGVIAQFEGCCDR
jgi:hypothetical protein